MWPGGFAVKQGLAAGLAERWQPRGRLPKAGGEVARASTRVVFVCLC